VFGVYGGPGFIVRYPNGDESQYVMICFECEAVGGALLPDGDETVEVRYWTADEAAALPLTHGLRRCSPPSSRAPHPPTSRRRGGSQPETCEPTKHLEDGHPPSAKSSCYREGWMIFDPQAASGATPLDANERVLEKLAAVGADVGAPTEVNVYLYFPSQDAASRAAEQVRALGFPQVLVSESLNESWACIGTWVMAPELNAIRDLAARLEEVARAHGGEYDGWEAAVHY
jgi:hypothetical protein